MAAEISGSSDTTVGADFDAIVVGAGFAGMYMLHRLRELGLRVRGFEAAAGVGGTWYWNRYPGARCDTESIEYSYGFSDEIQQQWEWSERYPTQPEILTYANWVAKKLAILPLISFETSVTSARFDESDSSWTVETNRGDQFRSQFCIFATGCLSTAQLPDIPGRDTFAGDSYHTGQWPHEGVDFTGLRVGIVGTGSSAIQSIPVVAQQARHLFVFQRTPNYSVPAHNGPLDPVQVRIVKERYQKLREQAKHTRRGYIEDVRSIDANAVHAPERDEEFERRWQIGGLGFLSAYTNLLSDERANESAAEFVRKKIRSIVRDPDTADSLMPRDYPIGTKRLCIDSHYFETFNRTNVSLVDLRKNPITSIVPTGIQTADRLFEVDAIIFATGFDAMTGALNRVDIRGRDGISLNRKWEDGPSTYLGLSVSGFPNLFMITGPGSPSVLSNMMVSIEQHVDWVANCIRFMQSNDIKLIDACPVAESEWTRHVNETAGAMLFSQGNSWWKGANVPGKPVVFMPYAGGVGHYRRVCDEVAKNGYRGFNLYSESRSHGR